MRNIQNATFTFADGISCLELANSYTIVATESAINKIEEALK
jgi:ribosomal protein L4